MAKKELNEQQKQAVQSDGRELLISASAGTGKTSTMCQRILHRIQRKENPLSLDRALIVTFTVASAADMRKQLGQTLRDALSVAESNEEKEALRKQLRILPTAKICTIDSFCYDLVRTRFDVLGLSAKMRIGDKSEFSRIKQRMMKKAMDALYKGETKERFCDLVDGLLQSYSDRELAKTFIRIYEKLEDESKGIELLKENIERCARSVDLPFTEGEAGAYLSSRAEKALDFYISEYSLFIDHLEEEGIQKNLELSKNERTMLLRAKNLLTQPEAYFDFLHSVEFMRATAIRADEYYDRFKIVRACVKKFCALEGPYSYSFDARRRLEILTDETALLNCLYELFVSYRALLDERKRSIGVFEFSDIERFALKLLCADGKKTPLAESLAEGFDEIYVDEYQDVNPLQNSIFEALSRNNRYMVGDIKQSIYGFRGAKPEIFNSLRESYPPLHEESDKGRIFFERNYRCAGEVVRFVNAACSELLPLCDDMHYYPEDDLVCARPGENEKAPDKCALPTICLVSAKSPLLDSEDIDAEALYTAKCVKAMIGKGVKGEDIAILVPKMNKVQELRAAFDYVGVPLDVNANKGFFDHPEILLLRSILEMLSNPTSDIYLAGAMKSPAFGFSLDDLYKIRSFSESESLYGALLDYTAETGNEKCRELLAFIGKYRQRAKEWQVDRLLYAIMEERSLIPLLTYMQSEAKAAEIKDRMLCFYDLVRGLSQQSYGQIGAVLRRISDMAAEDDTGEGKSTTVVKGHVRLMTIHSSKGLEFPVCWLFGMGESAEGRSLGAKTIISEKFGVALKIKDRTSPLIKSYSENAEANAAYTSAKEFNERLRLLYVALTRAKDRLYISATRSAGLDESISGLPLFKEGGRVLIDHYKKWISFLFWALRNNKDLYTVCVDEYPEGLVLQEDEPEEDDLTYQEEEIKEKVRILRERLSFVYPHKAAVDLPAKEAVSHLYPALLDEENEGELLLSEEEPAEEENAPKPLFIYRREGQNYSTGAERGTATHAFMQFCNFKNMEEKGFDHEAQRLLEKGFLDEHSILLVERKQVERFFESDLYKDIKRAKLLKREQRFMIALPAAEFTQEEDKKAELRNEELLVQGVMDGFFESEKGEIVLFDYKTDHFSRSMLRDPALCMEKLRERHTRQMTYYKEALKRMLGRTVDRCLIYSFALSREVEV